MQRRARAKGPRADKELGGVRTLLRASLAWARKPGERGGGPKSKGLSEHATHRADKVEQHNQRPRQLRMRSAGKRGI